MASTSSKEIIFYYGFGNLEKLADYQLAILQAEHYSGTEIQKLAQTTRLYAYLSLGEDAGDYGPWQRQERNHDWDSAYVDIGSSLWQEQILNKAAAYFEQGFIGLFLDTLDAVDVFPEYRSDMLFLISKLKDLAQDKPLIANRGFSLMPELEKYVAAIVFEGFSSTWSRDGKYNSLKIDELAWTKVIAKNLQSSGLELWALDYAKSEHLIDFAKKRAQNYGLKSIISNRELTRI